MKIKTYPALFSLEVVCITLFLSAFILYSLLSSYNFSLGVPHELYISQATFDGQDIGKRVNFFYKATLYFSLLFISLYSFFNYIIRKLKTPSIEFAPAAVFAVTGFFLLLSDLVGIQSENIIKQLALLTSIFIFFPFIKKYFPGIREVTHPVFTSIAICIAFSFTSGILLLGNGNEFLQRHVVALLTSAVLFVFTSAVFIKYRFRFSSRNLFEFLKPLSFIPLFIFLSIETAFFFKIRFNHPLNISILFIGLLIISVVLNLFRRKRKSKTTSIKRLKFFYAPSALLSFLLLTSYNPVLYQLKEIFELANPANALMNIFAFKQIPFLDFMSSHMFAEQFYGIIYFLAFGYDGSQSFWIYGFLYTGIVFVIAYYFLNKIIKQPALVVLFLVCFPFLFPFLSVHLFYGLLLFFLVQKLMVKQTVSRYLLLFGGILLFIAWRLDTGSALLFSMIFFLPVSFYSYRQKVNVSALLKSFLILILIGGLLVVAATITRSPDYILSNFKCALHYASANQAHGYSSLSAEIRQQFYIYHVFLPLASVLFILFIIVKLRRSANSFSYTNNLILSASMFLFMLCIFNFQRGLVRHGFMEQTEHFLASTFYIALSLFIFYFIRSHNSSRNYICFFTISFLVFVLLKYFPISSDPSMIERFFIENTVKNIDHHYENPNLNGRIIPETEYANDTYAEFKKFLDKNLKKEQSFIDFSNSPMLYFYCSRNVPSYFCQSLQNTVDDYLQLDMLKRSGSETIPVAVYSNYPPNWFDATDGVPNIMRQYLVAEYIYKNYHPFGIINNKSIWTTNNSNFTWDINQHDTICLQPHTFEYKKAAFYINRYYDAHHFNLLNKIAEQHNLNKGGDSSFFINEDVSRLHHVYARIIMSGQQDGNEINVTLNDSTSLIGSFTFQTTSGDSAYMLRLSNHYLWHIKHAQDLTIKKPSNIHIEKVEFYNDVRL